MEVAANKTLNRKATGISCVRRANWSMPAASLIIFAAVLALTMPQGARGQKATGAGTGSERVPARSSSTFPTQALEAPGSSPVPRDGNGTGIAAAASTVPRLADMAWLTGSWQGVWGPRVAQQVWTAPNAGVMLGNFQLVENGKTLVVELFALTETPGGIELRIRHFTPSLVPWEKGGAAVLHLTGGDAKSATFENSTNGEPKTQSFRRMDADTYISRSEVVPPEGNLQIAEITFRRVREAAPKKH
jgi:Domain of unknown function (DUF6265)